LIDIDLPGDYVFWAPGEDSNRESHHSSIPIPAPATEAAEEVHSSSEEVVFTDSDPSEDGLDGDDEVMSGQRSRATPRTRIRRCLRARRRRRIL